MATVRSGHYSTEVAFALPLRRNRRHLAPYDDIVPDDIPVIGYLYDVIIIERMVRESAHVLEAYEEFCAFRENYDKSAEHPRNASIRRGRIDGKRRRLHQRMKRRFEKLRTDSQATVLW